MQLMIVYVKVIGFDDSIRIVFFYQTFEGIVKGTDAASEEVPNCLPKTFPSLWTFRELRENHYSPFGFLRSQPFFLEIHLITWNYHKYQNGFISFADLHQLVDLGSENNEKRKCEKN